MIKKVRALLLGILILIFITYVIGCVVFYPEHDATIEGKVYDSDTKESLENACAVAIGKDSRFWYIAKTNSNGYYILYVLKNGNPYELVFQAPNYITSKPEWYSTVNVQEGDKLNINMGLKKLPQQKLRIVLHMPKKERYEINNDFNAYIWLPYGKSLHDDYHSLGSGSTDNVYTHRYGSTEVYTDIFQWDPGKYTFAVKRFNTDTPFFSTGCWVEIFDQNGIQIGNNISPPNSSPNDLWWHVLDINVQNETPQIDIINQMLENTPR